jgi:hypothetical protein
MQGMMLSCLLMHLGTVARDDTSYPAMPLIRRKKRNAAVPVLALVLVIVPFHRYSYPGADFLNALQGSSVVIRPMSHRAEQ